MGSTSSADQMCARMAATQHGLINRTQAKAAGLSDNAISHRVRSGRWRRVLPSVYQIAGTQLDVKARMMAVYLWAGEDCAISFISAARAHGVSGLPADPIHVSLPRRAKAPSPSVRVHFAPDLHRTDLCGVDEIGVTSPARTLLDLGAVDDPRLERCLDHLLRVRLVQVEDLWLLLDRPESFGRRGTRRLRDLVAQRSTVEAPSHSEMEDLFMRIVRRGRFPEPRRQHAIPLSFGTVHADFAYPERRLVIECDSYAFHMDREAFDRDRRRDAELQARGWNVLRLTWAQLRYNPDYVIAILREHLSRQVSFVGSGG